MPPPPPNFQSLPPPPTPLNFNLPPFPNFAPYVPNVNNNINNNNNNNIGDNVRSELELVREIDSLLEEVPEPLKLGLNYKVVSYPTKAPDILSNDFIRDKEIKKNLSNKNLSKKLKMNTILMK